MTRLIVWSPWRSLLWLLTACVFAGSGLLAAGSGRAEARTTTAAVQDPAFEAVDAYLREQVASIGIPGAAVVVVKDGRQAHQAAFGRADDSGRPMTAQTPVLLASVSKSLTAIAVMQQVEAGRLELDEPVRTYLPWFSMRDHRYPAITVRHLLHQSSGLSTADGSGFEGSDTQEADAVEQGVRELADSSLLGAPGEAFTYSNDNYNILGLLVETVAGQPFGDYMEEHVFGPLEMVHSHPTRASASADNMAAGHALWFGALWRETDVPAPITGMPSTTMYASAEDLGHQLTALLDGGRYLDGRILRPESVDTMLTPAIRVDDSKEYAMGWFARPLLESLSTTAPPGDGARPPLLLEHQGEWGNTHTYQAMVPASGLGVALVMNASDTAAPSRLKAIDSNILRILHQRAPEPAVAQEDPLQRYGWAVALALLLAELVSLAASIVFLRGRTVPARPWRPAAFLGVAALILDGLLLWVCLVYAPALFDVPLTVMVRQLPDVGIMLVPALALAIIWSGPRTVWLVLKGRRMRHTDRRR